MPFVRNIGGFVGKRFGNVANFIKKSPTVKGILGGAAAAGGMDLLAGGAAVGVSELRTRKRVNALRREMVSQNNALRREIAALRQRRGGM